MFYIWIGQKNTTTGTSNVLTCRLSLHGDLKAFETRKDRDNYFNNCYSRKMYTTMERTNKHDAKSSYFAGMSKDAYNDYIKEVDHGYISLDHWYIEESHYS